MVEDRFGEFVRARPWALQRTAHVLTGDRHLAEDLVQEALARTHRALRRLGDEGHYEGVHPHRDAYSALACSDLGITYDPKDQPPFCGPS